MKWFIRAALSALALVVLAGAAKINTPRVLLPWIDANTRVNFTFEITEGGCYSWSLSRDDLVSLEAQYEDSWGHCSRSAVVNLLPACSLPGSVIILAEDVVTGEIIRGDLNVDRIHSIKIQSTTWKLYLEEAPEAFEVEVFDEHGNKFSTLEGIEFNWTVENKDTDNEQEPFVKLVWWQDTDYEAPKGIAELESMGRRSYSVLLYAQTMGEAKVKVCLNSTCDEVALRVVPSVILQPAIAIIAPGDSIRMKVVRAKKGKLRADDVSDTMYRLHVPDDGVTYLEDGVSLVQGREIGTTSISLISGSTEIASSSITVSSPHSIRVILRPSNLLVRNEPFLVRALVLDKQGRALTAGENILIRLLVEGEANVKLVRSTENGTVTDAVASDAGTFIVTAYLHSVGGKTLSKKIQGMAEGTVVEPLQIIPPELFIAWTDKPVVSKLRHTGGGEGAVVWRTEQTNGNIHIGPEGEVTAETAGSTVVHAHLVQHPHVKAQAEVLVSGAQYMQVASVGGARVGRPHPLHVALTGTHPRTGALFTFHACDCNGFDVTLLDGPEPYNVTAATWIEPLEGACCVLAGTWRERGACALRVSHGLLADTVRVLVREGPKLIWPQSAALLLGAKLPILASGEALTALSADSRIADVRVRSPPKPFAHPDLQMFTVNCVKKGETSIELKSQSEDSMTEDGGSSSIACVPRASRVRVDAPAAHECPGAAKLWVRAGGTVRLHVALLDAVGRELHDETAHKVSWETSPGNSGLEFSSPDRLLLEIDPEYDPVPVPLRYYQELRSTDSTSSWSGTIKATAGDVSTTIQANIVSAITATTQSVSLAWEVSTASRVATISGGSGHYTVEANKGSSAWIDSANLLATWPAVGRYELVVSDSCVLGEAISIAVRVEEIASVEVAGPRAVCVGTCVAFAATAHGASGRGLAASAPAEWLVRGGAEYRDGKICGLREGAVTVRAAIGGVWSREIEVVVFPLLRIRPERLRLPPGARVQLSHTGGAPQRLLNLHYTAVQQRDAITVQPTGLLTTLRIGSARVRLTAKDMDGAEIAHTEADVEVVGVTGVRGVSATGTLLVGAESPMWLEASPDLTPEALAALHPAPRVTWRLRDSESAALAVPLKGIQSLDKSSAEGLSVRVTPLRDGPITVDVHVDNFVQGDEMRSFNTVVELLAVPILTTTIDNFEVDSSDIALAVGSTVQLRSSLKTRWRSLTLEEQPPFEITSSGEVRALREGFGVAIGRYRDEKNDFDRQTSVHIEVAIPHYITTQMSTSDDGTMLKVEARSKLGRVLIGYNLSPTTNSRIGLHRTTGSIIQVTGLEASGAFVHIGASTSASTFRDYFWLDPPERSDDRIHAVGGQAVCLQGGGWRAPAGVWLGERGGVTLVVLQSRAAARLNLYTEKPQRGVTIVQSAANKLDFLPGEWPATLVPLSLGSETADGAIACTEEERSAVAGLEPELAYKCVTNPPYTAKAVIDTSMGQMGCSVSPDSPVTEAREADVCAEWGELRACARVLLLPPVRVAAERLVLTGGKESFAVTGHPLALKSVVITPSPGIKSSVERTAEGLVVSVWSEERECGAGWLWVRAKRTGQALRVLVLRECEATCGSLLAIMVSLIRPYFSSLVSAALAAVGALYFYSKMTSTRAAYKPTVLAPPSHVSPVSPLSPPTRTWQRSPYAPPRTSLAQTPPVYGDTTLIADDSLSPNASQTQINSRFL